MSAVLTSSSPAKRTTVQVRDEAASLTYHLVFEGDMGKLTGWDLKRHVERVSHVPVARQCLCLSGSRCTLSDGYICLHDGVVLCLEKLPAPSRCRAPDCLYDPTPERLHPSLTPRKRTPRRQSLRMAAADRSPYTTTTSYPPQPTRQRIASPYIPLHRDPSTPTDARLHSRADAAQENLDKDYIWEMEEQRFHVERENTLHDLMSQQRELSYEAHRLNTERQELERLSAAERRKLEMLQALQQEGDTPRVLSATTMEDGMEPSQFLEPPPPLFVANRGVDTSVPASHASSFYTEWRDTMGYDTQQRRPSYDAAGVPLFQTLDTEDVHVDL